MPFRQLPNGVVEVDTIDELRQLQRSRGRERQAAPHAPTRPLKSTTDLTDTTKQFLLVLNKAPNGLNTAQIAKKLDLDSRSIPPLMRSISRWCRDNGQQRDKLMNSTAIYVNRRPVTLYALTDEGRTVFGPIAADQIANLNGKEITAAVE